MRWAALCAWLALGCEATPADPDATVGLDAPVTMPDAGPSSTVALPAPASHGPCPEGWRPVEVEGLALCDPWPESGIAACAGVDEAHFPGGAGCERVGAACGADGFADGLPATGVRFVRAGAVGGDGSRASPFGRVADALAGAASGTIVALSIGTHLQDQIDLPAGVTLRGACTAETVLRSDADGIMEYLGVVTVRSAGGAIENLRIEGARPGITVNAGSVAVRDVVIAGATGQGVHVLNGGALDAERLVVRGTLPYLGMHEGVGLQVGYGSTATVARAVFANNRIAGVTATGEGTVVRIEDASAQDTLRAAGTDTLGVGFAGDNGARLELARVAVDRASYAGIRALAGATVTVDLAVVRDVEQSANITALGAGVAAEAAILEGRRVWIDRASHAGAIVYDAGARLALTDALVRGTRIAARPAPDLYGLGVWAQDGGELSLERATVVDNAFLGVIVQRRSAGTLRDVVIRGTRGRPIDGTYGRGLEVIEARVTLERALFERNHDVSVTAYRAPTVLDARDVTIRETLANADGTFGYGLQVIDGPVVTLDGLDVEGSRGNALLAWGAGTAVTLARARIAGVGPFDCAPACATGDFAYGVASATGGQVTMSAFVLEGAGTAALQLAGGEADLSDGEIADTPIGFNVQTPGFDEARLRTGVRFRAVGVEVDRSALTVGVQIPPFGI